MNSKYLDLLIVVRAAMHRLKKLSEEAIHRETITADHAISSDYYLGRLEACDDVLSILDAALGEGLSVAVKEVFN